jgi:regulatory protein
MLDHLEPSLERLRTRALRHLARYACSRARLRRVLLRSARRSAAESLVQAPDLLRQVEEVLDQLEQRGLLDDEAFAVGRLRRLVDGGKPLRVAAGRLEAEGIDREIVRRALGQLRAEGADTDLAAAVAFARRRRLGPWRPRGDDTDAGSRDLLRMCRAGFPTALARRVLSAAHPDELAREIEIRGASAFRDG